MTEPVAIPLSIEDWRLIHDCVASMSTNLGHRESKAQRHYTKGGDPIPFAALEALALRLHPEIERRS